MSVHSGDTSGAKKRGRLLVFSVCKFETHSRGGLVWRQTAAHGRAHGSGIPGKKRGSLLTTEVEEEAATLDRIPAPPRACRLLSRAARERGCPVAGKGARGADDDKPAPQLIEGDVGGACLGAAVADEDRCYEAAIRAQLYPLLALLDALQIERKARGGADERHAPHAMVVKVHYQSLATRVFRLYEALDYAARAVFIGQCCKNSRSGRFSTARLRALQQFVLGVGGAGLWVRQQRRLFYFLEILDRRDMVDPMATSDSFSLSAVFPTVSSFKNALRDNLNKAVIGGGQNMLSIREGGTV